MVAPNTTKTLRYGGAMMRDLLHQARTAARRTRAKWALYDNAAPFLAYHLSPKATLSQEQSRVLADLDRDGVATTTVQALFGSDRLLNELQVDVGRQLTEKAEVIAAARVEYARPGRDKAYRVHVLGDKVSLDPASIYARIALHASVRDVVNAYMGLFARLRYYNIWLDMKGDAPARESQLWHRDPDDRFIPKMFVLLSHVDAGAGPFSYVRGSHGKGRFAKTVAPFFREQADGALRSTDEQMESVVPREHWFVASGPPGTVVLADTRGYHKGGLARTQDRLVYNAMFTSPGVGIPYLDNLMSYERDMTGHVHSAADAFSLGTRGGRSWK